MKTLALDWPFAVRNVVTFAQQLADARGHAETSPAHVCHVLYAMKPVRAIVGAELTASAVETRLLVERKATVTKALLTSHLERLLFGPTSRTTVAFLEGFSTGAERVGRVFAEHAAPIAAALDHAGLEATLKTPDPNSALHAYVILGFIQARKAKHAELTARHIVLASLVAVDEALREKGLDGLEADVARLVELIERTVGKSESPRLSPNVFGTIAGILSQWGQDAPRAQVMEAFVEGDEAIAFAAEAERVAREHLKAT
jgi:hypothetical protein